MIERVGRRGSLMSGAFFMGCFMLIVALLVKTHPPDPKEPINSTGIVAVIMVYLEASESASVELLVVAA